MKVCFRSSFACGHADLQPSDLDFLPTQGKLNQELNIRLRERGRKERGGGREKEKKKRREGRKKKKEKK